MRAETESKQLGRIVLEVQGLKTYFYLRRGVIKAVDGVSLYLRQGEVLGLVGESGSGKTITSLSLLRLLPRPAGRIVAGTILLDGEDLLAKSEKEMSKIRGQKIGVILQDPMCSLNPVFTIGDQITEPLKLHQKLKGDDLRKKAYRLLELMRIPSPEVIVRHFPHQLSGGMRQRVVGSIGLSCEPQLLIADEPTTALDVTTQADFLRLLKETQKRTNLSILLITHDFGVVAEICDRVAVMYAGRIIESAPVVELFDHPKHPYTRALMASVPSLTKRVDTLYSIEGQPPNLLRLPRHCAFLPRCSGKGAVCDGEYPPEVIVGTDHTASCWHVN